ncbi:hypothetical protein [Streptomyces prasinopilosus]|uniref:Exonuclease SbcC n=1 Tax=Streptomyces prasinopilosus TaxID=67344 RepID=A0A1G7BIJ3_9ACTN|nr:hypothetical protein [Streptomyces prasinopilosus]SDE26793.1 hypothetical protein SAMN05216505_1244 [Streptomyces prasinopilosus]
MTDPRHRLNEAQRAQRAAQRKLGDAQRHRGAVDTTGVALLRLAQREGLLEEVPAAPGPEEIRRLLEQALTVTVSTVGPVDLRDRRQGLSDERRELREKLQQLDEALALVDRWQKQGEAFTGELHLQLGRLQTINLLGPERDHDTAVCPMCTRPLEEPDASAAEIATLTAQLSEELEQAQTIQPIRDEHRRSLQTERAAVIERLRVNGAQLRELAASDERMRSLQDQHVRIARIQGRIDQALTVGTGAPAGDIGELRNNLNLAQENDDQWLPTDGKLDVLRGGAMKSWSGSRSHQGKSPSGAGARPLGGAIPLQLADLVAGGGGTARPIPPEADSVGPLVDSRRMPIGKGLRGHGG